MTNRLLTCSATITCSALSFYEVASWLTSKGDNEKRFPSPGVWFFHADHKRWIDAIFTAFVKLRQRNEHTGGYSDEDKKFLNSIEDEIVEFCSFAVNTGCAGIRHPMNKNVWDKFKNLAEKVKKHSFLFNKLGLDQQVSVKKLKNAGLLSPGAPSVEALNYLATKL